MDDLTQKILDIQKAKGVTHDVGAPPPSANDDDLTQKILDIQKKAAAKNAPAPAPQEPPYDSLSYEDKKKKAISDVINSPYKDTTNGVPLWDRLKGAGSTALQAAGYLGGGARTAVLGTLPEAAGAAKDVVSSMGGDQAGQPDLLSKLKSRGATMGSDISNAFTGNAPPSSEFFKRYGVPEGPHVNLMPEFKIPFTDTTIGKGDTSMRDVAGFVGDVGLDPLTYLSLGASTVGEAGLAGRALNTADHVLTAPGYKVGSMGESMYKSGLKGIDAVGEKYGKEPVSDLLLQKGVSGSAKKINSAMEDLSAKSLAERNQILENAKAAGGESSMKTATAPLEGLLNDWRASRDPELLKPSDSLQSDLDRYKKLDRQYAQTPIEKVPGKVSTIDLPMQGAEFTPIKINAGGASDLEQLPQAQAYDWGSGVGVSPGNQEAVGRTMLPASVEKAGPTELAQTSTGPFQYSEPARMQKAGPSTYETPGVDPVQSSGFKTSLSNKLNDAAFTNNRYGSAYEKGTKVLAGGMKDATNEAVERSLGPEARQALEQRNDELSRLLTSQEKARMEAVKEGNKNSLTSVDGMLVRHPWELLAKKLADISKATAFRTTVGKSMYYTGENPLARGAISTSLREPFTPWNNQTPKDQK